MVHAIKRVIFKLFGWIPAVKNWELDDRIEHLLNRKQATTRAVDYPDELSPNVQVYDPRAGQHIRSKT